MGSGEVCCESPNNRLDRFKGTLTFSGHKYSLDNEKILLRGCTLRNTDWCFGLVLFAGDESDLKKANVLNIGFFGTLLILVLLLHRSGYKADAELWQKYV